MVAPCAMKFFLLPETFPPRENKFLEPDEKPFTIKMSERQGVTVRQTVATTDVTGGSFRCNADTSPRPFLGVDTAQEKTCRIKFDALGGVKQYRVRCLCGCQGSCKFRAGPVAFETPHCGGSKEVVQAAHGEL